MGCNMSSKNAVILEAVMLPADGSFFLVGFCSFLSLLRDFTRVSLHLFLVSFFHLVKKKIVRDTG